jgi:glucose-6-phosphate 1-dehydrogenase
MTVASPEPSALTRPRSGSPIVREPPPEPCIVVIFGITGDLAHRKLVPALYRLQESGALSSSLCLVGVTRQNVSRVAVLGTLRAAAERAVGRPIEDAAWQGLSSSFEIVSGELDEPETFAVLRRTLDRIDGSHDTDQNRIYYLATPPEQFPTIAGRLAGAGLVYDVGTEPGPWSRLIIEKPFGRDLASAEELDRLLDRCFDERQIFRIDHYLGKETVQNILVLRFANSLFEPLWNRRYIDHVEITAAESLGVEQRGRFYDRAGVVRDIVQNHLLQVLALSAMEPPISFSADDVRNQKLALLRAIRPIGEAHLGRDIVAGQYQGYQGEPGVDPASRTPTYVAMKLSIDSWRWQGVPFYLRAGKKLARQMTEVSVHFQEVPLCLFPRDGECTAPQPNVLTIRLQPDEGISLRFEAKIPGDHLEIDSVLMRMGYRDTFKKPLSDAYERLLLDCMRGDPTLFARRDEVEQAWRLITPIVSALDRGAVPIARYEPGRSGPAEADRWIAAQGRHFTPL